MGKMSLRRLARCGRGIRLAAFIVIAVAVGLAGRRVLERLTPENLSEYGEDEGAASAPDDPARVAAVNALGRAIAPLHERKRPAQPNDWLALHPEEVGETFAQYRSEPFHGPSARRTTIYLQPWGELDPSHRRIFDEIAEAMASFFGVPVHTLAARSLAEVPPSARIPPQNGGAERLLTSYLLGILDRDRPRDAIALMAITAADLSPQGSGSWVFGQARRGERVGICSFYRQGDPRNDYTLCLRRTLKTALHETGHILGFAHCTAYECAMNGSHHLEEADSHPLWYCPEDEMKLWWACPVDPLERYRRLSAFAETRGLSVEARFWRASRSALRKTP